MFREHPLSWHLVPNYVELFIRGGERNFQNLVYEVIISIQFVEGLFEHFQLQIKVHAYRTIEAVGVSISEFVAVVIIIPIHRKLYIRPIEIQAEGAFRVPERS